MSKNTIHKQRFIPAHAGNTRHNVSERAGFSVHPRARGEHGHRGVPVARRGGSSPRTRGTPLIVVMMFLPWRFIPAHAGNTSRRSIHSPVLSVHPRARGEHYVWLEDLQKRGGSSPRTRGTLAVFRCARQTLRFIPAHAGNTPHRARFCPESTVHPRARGEHAWPCATRAGKRGSSPRTRGTLKFMTGAGDLTRFIPAHAGNTGSKPE